MLRIVVLAVLAILVPASVHAAGVHALVSAATGVAAMSLTQIQAPYGGTARPVPGRIEAEYFDEGGPNIAYFENDTVANGYFRAGDVDLANNSGVVVERFRPGEWLEFTVDVTRSGYYTVKFHVGNASFDQLGNVGLEVDGQVRVSSLAVTTSSGGSLQWSTPQQTNVLLAKGQRVLRVKSQGTAEIAFNWVEFTLTNGAPTISLTAPSNNQQFAVGATVPFTATASDTEGTVSKIEFYRDGTLLTTDTSSPYSSSWSNAQQGTYVLTAKAFDDNNLTESTDALTIYVGNRSPIVALTAPVGGTVVNAPATLTLAASASDPDGSISRIEFYNGTTLLNADTTAPFSYDWTNVAAGTYSLTAKAFDNSTGVTTSSAVSAIVNALPAVTITSPANGAVIVPAPATVAIAASASDSDGSIAKVEYYNGATLLGTTTSAPHTYNWTNVAAGTYSLYARAYDNRNANTTTAATTVVVNTPPAVSITAPANNAVLQAPASFTISATAADSDGSVAKVDFYQGATLLGSDTTSPYQWPIANLAAGAYSYTAKATDNRGTVTTSSAVMVMANGQPTVALTAPTDGSEYTAPATVTLTATASDADGTISKVEFLNGSTVLFSDSAVPYAYTWLNVPAGTHTVSAKVYDDRGGIKSSTTATILVKPANAAPTVLLTSPKSNRTYNLPAHLAIEATATDDGQIDRVEFYNGSTLIDADPIAPYAIGWQNVPPGTYTFKAKAYDEQGLATFSAPVTVVVTTNRLPTVRIVAPTSEQAFEAPVTIGLEAEASDDSSIAEVRFYQGTTLLGSDSSAPYEFDWVEPAPGSYRVTADAVDNTGATASSTPIQLIVNRVLDSNATVSAAELPVFIDNSTESIGGRQFGDIVGVCSLGSPIIWGDGTVAPMRIADPEQSVLDGTDAATDEEHSAQAELTPGRYYDSAMPGHGWDFFWYTENGGTEQHLFVTWYTHRKEGTKYRPVWFGATGEVKYDGNDRTRRIGFEGTLWEFTQYNVDGPDWGWAGSIAQARNTNLEHAREVGRMRLEFDRPLESGYFNPETAGIWWELDADPLHGTPRMESRSRFANSPETNRQCLRNFGAANAIGGAGEGFQGKNGTWWMNRNVASGAILMSYFYQALEHQVLLYFPGTANNVAPRWAHAVSGYGLRTGHPCFGRGYYEGQPRLETTDLCLLDLEGTGYAPDGADALPGGWDAHTGQRWIGTLRREYSATDASAGSISIGITAPDVQTNVTAACDASLSTDLGTCHRIEKRISVHKMEVDGFRQDGTCQVQTSGPAAGYCDLKLHWITNNFTSAAVYMHRLTAAGSDTNERSLVRATAPITPAAGYPYPPRGGAEKGNPFNGIAAGEKYRFELYSDRARGELLAVSPVITGSAATSCTSPPVVYLNSPDNGTTSAGRPMFAFSAGAGTNYRIRIYESPIGGAEKHIAEFGGARPESGRVQLPNYHNGLLVPGPRYRWTVQALTPGCGAGPEKSAYFWVGVPTIPDYPHADNPQPTPSLDTAIDQPLVGTLPMSASVSGGSATVEIPIEVPPGRHGMQPSLALTYSSRGGNGIAGLGWSLSGMSSIHRCPSTVDQDGKALGVQFAIDDKLCLDGQRLVHDSGNAYGTAGANYRLELDDMTRVTQSGAGIDSLGTSFTVVLKSGETREYGVSSDSRSKVIVKRNTATQSTAVLAWHLNRRSDRAGNSVKYAYTSFGATTGETLLSAITYTHGVNDSGGDRSVVLTYTPRLDKSTTYLAGAAISQTQRLLGIETKVGTKSVRWYEPSYASEGGTGYSTYSARTLLREMHLCAFDENGANEKCLPRTVFRWSEAAPTRKFRHMAAIDLPGVPVDVDTDGDGPDGGLNGAAYPEAAAAPPVLDGGAPDNPLEPYQYGASDPQRSADSDADSQRGGAMTVINDNVDPGPLRTLTPLADIDGDGTIEFLAQVIEDDPATTNVIDRASYLVKLNADRQVVGTKRVPWRIAAGAGAHLDLDNDGRAEFWGVDYGNTSDPVAGAPVGTYPIKRKLQIFRWRNAAIDWSSPQTLPDDAIETIDPEVWIETGRIVIADPNETTPGNYVNLKHFSGFTDFADVDGDGKPDLIVSRTSWGADDPLEGIQNELNCTPDEAPYESTPIVRGGDVLLVYRNTSGATGTTKAISFDPTPIHRECLGSVEEQLARRRYDKVTEVLDFNGDSVIDLRIGTKLRFGKRAENGAISWPRDFNASTQTGDYEIADFPGGNKLDVNGDGLLDLHYSRVCTSGLEHFIRLNTGSRGPGALGDPIRVEQGTGIALGTCSPPGTREHWATFTPVADIDADGRSELLYPVDFAARICTYLKSPEPLADGSYEWLYYCPERPYTTQSLPVEVRDLVGGAGVDRVGSLYQAGHDKWDYSAYTMGALRFVDDGIGADGKPRIYLQKVPSTGIVATPRNTLRESDLFGDGLTDTFASFGCPFSDREFGSNGSCIALTDANAVTTNCPKPSLCGGPAELLDTDLPADASGVFVSENFGSATDTLVLPELLQSTSNYTYDDHCADCELTRTTWRHVPLSSSANRAAAQLPLYSVPSTNRYIDERHFYFTSSMPVVEKVTQSSGSLLDGRVTLFGYREAMYHNRGRGFRGFRTIIEEDQSTGLRTTTKFEQKFPLVGLPICAETSLITDADVDCDVASTKLPITSVTTQWVAKAASGGDCSNGVAGSACLEKSFLAPVSMSQEAKTRDLAPARALVTRMTTSSTYDAQLNELTKSSTTKDYIGLPESEASTITRTASITRTYENNATLPTWWVNKLVAQTESESVAYGTAVAPPDAPTTSRRTRVYGWHDSTRQPDCEAVLVGSQPSPPSCATAKGTPGWESTTTTEYGDAAFGNPTEVIIDARGFAAPRSTTIGYAASSGYFANTTTNAKEHSTEAEYLSGYGLPKRVTDARRLTTTTTYDVLGRAIAVLAPATAGNAKRMAPPAWTARQWCDRNFVADGVMFDNCAADARAKYRVIVEQPGTPTRIDYLDRLGQVVLSETEGFDTNEWVRVKRAYDARGLVTYETSPAYATDAPMETHYQHDALGRMTLKSRFQPDLSTFGIRPLIGVDTTYAYAGLTTNIEVVPSSNGAALAMSRTYASDGKLFETEDALKVGGTGGRTRFWYDGMGNPVAIRDAMNAVIKATYDDLGRRITMSDPSRGNWSFTYSGVGELLTQTDARDRVLNFQYDALGRTEMRYWHEPDPHTPTINKCMVDTWEWDDPQPGLLGKESRTRVQQWPVPGSQFCSMGTQAEQAQRQESIVKTHAYDELYRVTDTTVAMTVGLKATTLKSGARYDSFFGRVKVRVFPGDIGVYQAYNIRGYPYEEGFAEEFLQYGTGGNNEFFRRIAEMNAMGQPTRIQYGRNQAKVNRYHPWTGALLETCAQPFTYSSGSPLETGGACDWALQRDGAPEVPAATTSSLSPNWMDIAYRYDAYGNVLEQRNYSKRLDTSFNSPIAETYTYDALHRVTTSSLVTASPHAPTTYKYDAIGNLLQKSDFSTGVATCGAGGACPYSYETQGKPHAVSKVELFDHTPSAPKTVSYTYDANGNMAARNSTSSIYASASLTYDIGNLPLHIREGTAGVGTPMFDFRYGPDLQRYYEESTGSGTLTTRWYLDKSYERDVTSNRTIQRYYVAPEVLYVADNQAGDTNTSGLYFSYGDRLGSTSVTTTQGSATQAPQIANSDGDAASSASNAQQYTYRVFGRRWNATSSGLPGLTLNSRGFTQHEHLSETRINLIHMNGRAYDPNLGQFLSVDPFISFPENSQSYNPYSYVLNNPLGGSDPTGYVPECDSPQKCSLEGGDIKDKTIHLVTTKDGEQFAAVEGTDNNLYRVSEISISEGNGYEVTNTTLYSDRRQPASDIKSIASRVNLSQSSVTFSGSDLAWETGNRVGKELGAFYGKTAVAGAVCGAGAAACLGLGNASGGYNLYKGNYTAAFFSFAGVLLGPAAKKISEELALVLQSMRGSSSGPRLFYNLAPDDAIVGGATMTGAQVVKAGYTGRLTYVVTQDGRLVMGKMSTGHIDLANGAPVRAAGEVKFVNGQVHSITNKSGHYQPSGNSALFEAESAFKKAGFDSFGKYNELY